jgi:hypothetical protein
MGNGNVKVLGETFQSFSSICDEIVYGDLLLWEEDRKILEEYKDRYNIKIVPLPWNALFKHGFSHILNELAANATNDMVVYANCSEVIEKDFGASEAIYMNEECNAFFFTHGKEHHRWFRCYNRNELEWSGLIHEQLKGEYRPYHKSIFQFADLEKDMDNSYKAKVLNLLKEYTYFQQYVKIVDHPELLGETDPGWVTFAKADYASFKERMERRPEVYRAIQQGNKFAFFYYIHNDKEFESEEFKSSEKIAFQGDKIHLL